VGNEAREICTMTLAIRKALTANGFKVHNNKADELVASKFHSSIRNVRIVFNAGVDKSTGKAIAGKHAQFKAVFINNQSQWRTIATGSTFKGSTRFASALIAIEVGAEGASACKCGAKKFKAKSGKVVCANACWANNGWSRKKKASNKPAAAKAPKGASASLRTPRKKTKATRAPARPTKRPRIREGENVAVEQFHVGQLVKIMGPAAGGMGVVVGVEEHGEVTRNTRLIRESQFITVRLMSGETKSAWNYRITTDEYLVYFTAAS